MNIQQLRKAKRPVTHEELSFFNPDLYLTGTNVNDSRLLENLPRIEMILGDSTIDPLDSRWMNSLLNPKLAHLILYSSLHVSKDQVARIRALQRGFYSKIEELVEWLAWQLKEKVIGELSTEETIQILIRLAVVYPTESPWVCRIFLNVFELDSGLLNRPAVAAIHQFFDRLLVTFLTLEPRDLLYRYYHTSLLALISLFPTLYKFQTLQMTRDFSAEVNHNPQFLHKFRFSQKPLSFLEAQAFLNCFSNHYKSPSALVRFPTHPLVQNIYDGLPEIDPSINKEARIFMALQVEMLKWAAHESIGERSQGAKIALDQFRYEVAVLTEIEAIVSDPKSSKSKIDRKRKELFERLVRGQEAEAIKLISRYKTNGLFQLDRFDKPYEIPTRQFIDQLVLSSSFETLLK